MKIFANLDFGGVARIVALLDPTSAQDAATKAYVDSAVEGLNWKDSVRVASTANINLASPGASIDGIALATNDRFLAKDQTAPAENGIYIWNGAATPATRALDMSVAAEVEQATVTVEEGTASGVTYRQSVNNVTLGTTGLTFTVFGTSAPTASETTAGLIEHATQSEVDAGTAGNFAVTAAKLVAWSGRTRTKTGNIGDGAATQYDITHNWNTRAVVVELFRNSTPWDTVFADVSRPDANTVRFNFATAPTSNQFTYVMSTGGTA